MNGKNKDETLIAKLLTETLINDPTLDELSENKKNLALVPRNECQQETSTLLLDLQENQVSFMSATYIQALGCFRIELPGLAKQIIDFPRNWSFFHQLYDALIYDKIQLYFHLSRGRDEENFLRIFHPLFPQTTNIVFFIEEHIVYMAFFREDQRAVMNVFLSHLEFKKEVQGKIFQFGI